ncbi:unnamed protein product [Boreogadus saida]
MSRNYKRYLADFSIPVPKTTRWYRSQLRTEERPASSTEEIDSRPSFEAEFSDDGDLDDQMNTQSMIDSSDEAEFPCDDPPDHVEQVIYGVTAGSGERPGNAQL